MTKEDKELLLYKIDAEGFDYCFNGYSSWGDIKDENFHKLRLAYVNAQNELKQYIKKCKHEN